MLTKEAFMKTYSRYTIIFFLNWLLYTNIPFLGQFRQYFIFSELLLVIPFIFNIKNIRNTLDLNIPFLSFLGISLLSSIINNSILNRYLWMTILLVIAIYSFISQSDRNEIKKLIDGIYISLNIILLISFIGITLILLTDIENSSNETISYSMGNFIQEGRFYGVLNNCNALGPIAGIATYLAILKIRDNKESSTKIILHSTIMLIDLFILIGSKSLSSEAAFACGFLVLILSYKNKNRKTFFIIFLAIMMLGIFVIIDNIDLLSIILQKDLRTATSRTRIWENALILIKAKPITGYGTFENYLDMAEQLSIFMHKAGVHNQYLEIALQYGVPALLLFILCLITTIYKFLKCYFHGIDLKDTYIAFPNMVLVFGIVHGLTEGQILFSANPNMIIFTTSLLLINWNLKHIERNDIQVKSTNI